MAILIIGVCIGLSFLVMAYSKKRKAGNPDEKFRDKSKIKKVDISKYKKK